MVKVARAEVATADEVLVTLGLGSCLAILLYDPVARVAGLAHVLLPEPGPAPPSNPWKYATTAVPHLLDEMERSGADRTRLTARLVGGASMFGALLAMGKTHTGERNLLAAREALRTAGVPITAEEVGKEHGRSVYFYAADGRVRVTTLEKGEREL